MASSTFEKYGLLWREGTDPLQLEFAMCRNLSGVARFPHFKAAMQMMWPEDDWHRWFELCLKEILSNKIVGILGPASSGKTAVAARYAITDYFLFPDCTCHLVSSTDIRGLELRVWGQIKDLFNRARERFPWLAGNVVDSMRTITTDGLDEDDNKARVLNKGIICIPCLQSGRYVGLGKYVGIKQKRLRLTSDECQLMGISFLDAISNLANNPDFHGNFMGNPIDPLDPLGMVCEPVGGWDKLPESDKTQVWKTKFQSGVAINLNGLDSPNNEFPGDAPRFPYLIHRKNIEDVERFWGKDSQQYFSQAVGVMKSGMLNKRIITRDFCKEHHAQDTVVWDGDDERVRIYAVDAAYSGVGGDRCVGGYCEFGHERGKTVINVNPPTVIPVSIRSRVSPEDQIAVYVRRDAQVYGIPVKNIFYDSTGRGTLGASFAKEFKDDTPVPVEFGGRPTKRPVRHDLYIYDTATNEKRLKRCDEHYYDFVTELWFSVRYIIHCDQMRGLPEDVMNEGCQREYGTAAANKIFIESKHDPQARKRMRISPDLFDWLATVCEGARQRGFRIEQLGAIIVEGSNHRWLRERSTKHYNWISSKRLTRV